MAELEAAKAEVERRIGRGEENGMRLHDRVLAYHIAKAYMIGQMDVKKVRVRVRVRVGVRVSVSVRVRVRVRVTVTPPGTSSRSCQGDG